MREIACPECGQKNLTGISEIFVECSRCFEIFNTSGTAKNDPASHAFEILGLTLTYQKNRRTIEIPAASKTVLGRNRHGSDVLKEIVFNSHSVISRAHCSIEFVEGKFYLRDENSTNGTFYGLKKIDCCTSPQLIEDNSAIWLGKELFEAQIHRIESETKPPLPEVEQRIIGGYRCDVHYCQFATSERLKECPKCGTRNSLQEFFE